MVQLVLIHPFIHSFTQSFIPHVLQYFTPDTLLHTEGFQLIVMPTREIKVCYPMELPMAGRWRQIRKKKRIYDRISGNHMFSEEIKTDWYVFTEII